MTTTTPEKGVPRECTTVHPSRQKHENQQEHIDRKELIERLALYAQPHVRAQFVAIISAKPTATLHAMLDTERRKCTERNRQTAKAAVRKHRRQHR